MDIYAQLSSIPHNEHYLRRYIKFVLTCDQKNRSGSEPPSYTEKHHICPRADDMFPQFASFKKHPWNEAILTFRQHVVAHIMLWKAYGTNSQTYALYFLLQTADVRRNKVENRIGKIEKFPTATFIRYLEKSREESSFNKRGKVRMMTPDGVFYGVIATDSPKVEELGLRFYSTENDKKNYKLLSAMGKEALTGSTIYNNGKREIKVKVHPGEGWIEGRLPRSAEHHAAQTSATRGAWLGATTYNDGKTNHAVLPGEVPEPHWAKGMAPQKIREFTYTNGIEYRKYAAKEEVPAGFYRAKAPPGTTFTKSMNL